MLLHPMYSHQKFILCIYSIELSFNVGKNKILFSVLRRAVFKYLLTLEIDLHFE